MNCENKNENVTNAIIMHTKKRFLKKECTDTGSVWIKVCPSCGNEQRYISWDSFRNAKRKNTICNICKTKNSIKYSVKERICPNCKVKIIYKSRRGYVLGLKNRTKCRTCSGRENVKNQDKSFQQNPEYRKKLSDALKIARKDETKFGESFRCKCRKNRAKQLQRGISGEVNFNPNACVFMDSLNNKFGWKLVHALNGGEKMVEGFFLDGWDEQRKIAFEYDEPKHHTLQQRKRDIIKNNVVKKYLSPLQFWRFDEKNNRLYETINGNEEVLL